MSHLLDLKKEKKKKERKKGRQLSPCGHNDAGSEQSGRRPQLDPSAVTKLLASLTAGLWLALSISLVQSGKTNSDLHQMTNYFM